MQRFLSTPLFRAHLDKSRTKLVCEASALVQTSRRKRPIYRSFCKKITYKRWRTEAGRPRREETGVPENRDSQARRVVRSHTHGEPILPPNFRRRVAGVPPVRREALRVGCGFSFSRADVKTPEFRGSFSFTEPYIWECRVFFKMEKCRCIKTKNEMLKAKRTSSGHSRSRESISGVSKGRCIGVHQRGL